MLKTGLNNSTKIQAINKAIKEKMVDSPMNCLMSCNLLAPTIFLNPTSLARFADLAVDKFIKFIQAMIKTNTAIMENV
ncbi:hypothetical protein ES708_27316 [subsurface metagenome]